MRKTLLLASAIALLASAQAFARRDHDPHQKDRHSRANRDHRRDKHKHHGHKPRREFFVERFAPESAPTPTTVTIYGNGFRRPIRIWLGSRKLRIVRITRTEIDVRIPPRAQTGVFRVVRRGYPPVVMNRPFVVQEPSRILRVTPTLLASGGEITIMGQGFRNNDEVWFQDQRLQVVSVGPRRIVATAPDGPRRGHISVRRHDRAMGNQALRWPGQITVTGRLPRIESIDPAAGGPGTVVHLRGRHLRHVNTVLLAGRPVKIQSHTPREIAVVTGPHHRSGRFTVLSGPRRVNTPQRFAVILAPKISHFFPKRGLPGTVVKLSGANFAPNDAVYLAERPMDIRRITPRRIVAVVPAGAQSGPISIRRGPHRHLSRRPFVVLNPAPVITNFSPDQVQPGMVIKIEGEHLVGNVTVRLHGRPLPVVKHRPPHKVMVRIPPHMRSGILEVSTDAGTARATHPLRIERLARVRSFTPREGPAGTPIRISGMHFEPRTRAFVGGTPLKIERVTPTLIIARIPHGASSGSIAIETGGRRTASNDVFTVIQPPVEISFTVAPHRVRRGDTVTITLSRPLRRVRVTLAGRQVRFRVARGGLELIVDVPRTARSGFIEISHRGKTYRSAHRLRVVR